MWKYVLISPGQITKSRIVGLNGRYWTFKVLMLYFTRNCQTVFQSGYTIMHFCQQCKRVSVAPHAHQPLILFIFFGSVILGQFWWLPNLSFISWLPLNLESMASPPSFWRVGWAAALLTLMKMEGTFPVKWVRSHLSDKGTFDRRNQVALRPGNKRPSKLTWRGNLYELEEGKARES